jgi:hypothetical protein
MKCAQECVDAVLGEYGSAVRFADSEYSNFMPAMNRILRWGEQFFGAELVYPILNYLCECKVDGSIARIFLGSLSRLIPGRQFLFESRLQKLLPNWQENLRGNPQAPLASEFTDMSLQVISDRLEVPHRYIEAIITCLHSTDDGVVAAGLHACQHAGMFEVIPACRKLWSSGSEPIRSQAILTSARLSVLDESTYSDLCSIAMNSNHYFEDRISASEAFLNATGWAQRINLSNVLSGEEIGSQFGLQLLNLVLDDSRFNQTPQVLAEVDRFFTASNLPESTLRRIARLPSISVETRQAAYSRVLSLLPQERGGKFGLIAHRNSLVTGAFVGHTGIFVDEDSIVHCEPWKGHHAVRKDSFTEWKSGNECWGIREDYKHPKANLRKAVDLALEIESWRTEYDGSHNNQKGKWFKPWFGGPKFWESDCVGFTEHCYEEAGGNPTPNDFEDGSGWPLTPREQRDHMRKVFDC